MKYNMTVAVVGSGFMGRTHAMVLKDLVEKLIICSNDASKGMELAKEIGAGFYEDYITMLDSEKIDFVSICLPTPLHHFGVTEAAKRGVNILCEKPFASSFEQANEMVKAARENNVLLMVAQIVRFDPNYEYLRRVVEDKRFGNVMYVNMYRNSARPMWSVGNWLNDAAKSGGVLCDMHIHETDIVVNVFGVPKKVFAQANPDGCNGMYIYDGKMVVNASSIWCNAESFSHEAGYDAVFENAVVRLHGGEVILFEGNEIKKPLENEFFVDMPDSDGYKNEIEYFCRCLSEGKEPLACMPEESVAVMAVNAAERESAASSQIVEVNYDYTK